MADNSIIGYNIEDNSVSFGNLSDETVGKLVSLAGKGFKSVLDPIHYKYEVIKINNIFKLMKEKGLDLVEAIKSDQTGWTLKFTKQILETAIIEQNNDIFDIWRKLIISFNDKDNVFREKCIRYSKITANLNSIDVHALNEIYNQEVTHLYSTDYQNYNFNSSLEDLLELKLIDSIRQKNISYSRSTPENLPFKEVTIYHDSSNGSPARTLHLNHKTKEFVDFMNQNI